jgi:hypothetical protein
MLMRVTIANTDNDNLLKENTQKLNNKLTNNSEPCYYNMHASTMVAMAFKASTAKVIYFLSITPSSSKGRLFIIIGP